MIILITAQKMKFPIKYFFSKCDQTAKLQIWSHLVKKSLTDNCGFCAVKWFLANVFILFNVYFNFFMYKRHFTMERVSSKMFQILSTWSLPPRFLNDQMSKIFCR